MEDFPVEGSPVDPFTGEPAYETSRRRGAVREARRGVGSRRSGRWRNVALGLGLILAILVGATGSLLYSALNRGYGSSAGTASPSATAHASDTSGPTATPVGSFASPDVSTSPGHSAAATSTTTPAPE